jgi:hypothetical protein
LTGYDAAELDIAQLERKRNALLAKMSVLADGVSTSFVTTQKHRAKAGTKEPPQVDSLFFKWRQVFEEDWPDVPDDPDPQALEWCYDRAETLVLEAEADLKRHTGQSSVEPSADGYNRTRQMVRDHVGHTLFQMARAERISESQARRARLDMKVCVQCGDTGCVVHGKR